MASNEETVESLSYLSRYIDDSRKRILALEQELESTRLESTNQSTTFSNDIRRLEAEKARIHGEIATLRDTLKVKQERSSDLAQVKLENETLGRDLAAVQEKLEHVERSGDVIATLRDTLKVKQERSSDLAQVKLENETLGRELAAVQEKLKHVEHSGDASQFVEERIALRQQITSFQEALKMKTARCLDIPRLEAENASLRKEIVSLQDALKVKKEPTSNPLDALADAPGSVPSEMQLKLIEDEREALQIKCTSLYAQVKQRAGLAAKALRERVEGLKELGKMRAEAENLTGELDRVKHMYDKVTAANDAGSAERAALVEANDAAMTTLHKEKATWRKTCETLTEQATSSSAALAKVKKTYKAVKKEKLALQETCRELIELVERISSVPVNNTKEADGHLEQDDDMSDDQEESEPETVSAQVTAVPRETYREYMKALPSPQVSSGSPPSKPRPVFTGRRELKAYLDTDKNLIRDLALSGTRPLDSEMMIQQQYPSGTIEIERMALQFVGFNHELYNTLRDDYCRRRTECRKRRAENAPEGNKRGPQKRQKV
ncbi:hypothetical protein DFH06DRAFT_1345984 [Mycena polygramma]|nr:hypothetical protein DFH06DRAFT_1345984 [Mycena polygramma]